MKLRVRSLPLLSGLRIWRCCIVGCRHSSDPALLWPWCRPAASAPIIPLAWEPPYAVGAAQEMAKRQKNKNKNKVLEKKSYLDFQSSNSKELNRRAFLSMGLCVTTVATVQEASPDC